MTAPTFPALKEIEGKIQTKQNELGTIFAEAGETIDFTKVRAVKGTTREIAAHVRGLNDELTDLAKEREDLLGVQKAAQRTMAAPDARRGGGAEPGAEPGRYSPTVQSTESLGTLFTKSRAYKEISGTSGPETTIDVELKALMSTTDGFAPETTRTGRLVESAQRPIQVVELIPQTTTTQSAIKYMEETLFVNNAAETAEGNQYPESALKYDEKSSIVRKISTYLPVTDEQLEDEPQVRGLIDNRLMFMIRQRLDLQILVGNGTAPNLTGILNTSGIQTQAKGGDPVPDAVFKAVTKVNVTGQAMANAVVMHPFDWQDIRLLRTADGLYIWGNPSDAGPERIWGLRVVQAQALTENTGLVGDFANFSELSVRRGVDVQVSNSHSDFFINGKLAVRADTRVALVVYRPAAFCTVTGI
jgi:HK97 family phage major capsid protein